MTFLKHRGDMIIMSPKIMNIKKRSCETTERDTLIDIDKYGATAIVIFLAVMFIFTALGAVNGQASFVLLTTFATAMCIVIVLKDSVFLNSLVAPFAVIFIAVSIRDFWIGAIGPFVYHLVIAIISMYIIARRNRFQFTVMMIASFVYASWIYLVDIFLMPTYIDGMYFTNNHEVQLLINFTVNAILSFIIWRFKSVCSDIVLGRRKK